MPEDIEFMREALVLARSAANCGEVPIGAVAVRDGVIVARAANRVEQMHSVSAHAEFELVRQLENFTTDWRMSEFTIYVTKEPCLMCTGMLINARIKRIVFGLHDPAGGGCGGAVNLTTIPGLLWHPEITGGIMEDEALSIIQDFFRSRRHKNSQ